MCGARGTETEMSKYRITLEGKVYEMEIEKAEEETSPRTEDRPSYREFKQTGREPTVLVIDPSSEKPYSAADKGTVTSPMPGTVMRIIRNEGEDVRQGETVLILEAMKMENEIPAPVSGKIEKMNCSCGDTVSGGEILFTIV